jgi:hypothetical protein
MESEAMATIFHALQRLLREEDGISGLETAGILASLVVVGSAISGAVLSAGIDASDQLKAAMTSSMERVTGNVEVRGMVVVTASDRSPNAIKFNLAPAPGGRAIPVEPDGANTLVINYRDANANVPAAPFKARWLSRSDDDGLLEAGELVEITLPLPVGSDAPCPCVPAANERFAVEILVPSGGVFLFERTLPPAVRPVMALP